jgi:hypothetical protein
MQISELKPADQEKNNKILEERMKAYNEIEGCRVGDYIRELNGRLTRVTHDWNEPGETSETIQHGGSEYGQYYLGNGYISYSGGLDSGIKKNQLKPTGEMKQGKVWFFNNDFAGAGRGIDFMVSFRVFEVIPDSSFDNKIYFRRENDNKFHVDDGSERFGLTFSTYAEMRASINAKYELVDVSRHIDTVTVYNGNDQPMIKDLPKVVLVLPEERTLDPVILNHIKKNTDLEFKKVSMGYEAQPGTSDQIVRLFMKENLNTVYHDNWNTRNTLFVAFNDMTNMPIRYLHERA